MKVTLIFPPHCDPSMPALAIPTLVPILRKNGHAVSVRDENLNAFEMFLSPDYLKKVHNRCLETLENWQSDRPEAHLQALLSAVLVADEVIDRIEDAISDLRSHVSVKQRMWAQRIVSEALTMISAAYYPTKLTPTIFISSNSAQKSDEVIQSLHDVETNPFIEFFKQKSVPEILAELPDVVGISVTFYSQLIPALTLAHCIRSMTASRKPYVVLGGGLISRIAQGIQGDLLRSVDCFALYEGEVAFPAFLRALEHNSDWHQVPNLLFEANAARVQTTCRPFDLHQHLAPEFDQLPLERYFLSEPLIPIQTARGCYWSRCTFCAIHAVDAPGGIIYRTADLESVVKHMGHLVTMGCRQFFFIDECLPPSRLRTMAQKILAKGLDVRWFCWVRFEPNFDRSLIQLLVQAGCTMISFGLESAVPEVLERMGKGMSLTEVSRILEDCGEAGLAVVPNFFIGFPGETQKQAEKTVDFVLENQARFRDVVWGRFLLERLSPIGQQPSQYGLVDVEPEGDLSVYSRYHPTAGMTLEDLQTVLELASAQLGLIYFPRLGLSQLISISNACHQDTAPSPAPQMTDHTPLKRITHLRTLFWSNKEKLSWCVSEDETADPSWRFEQVLILNRVNGRQLHLKPSGYKILQACDGQRDADSIAQCLKELGAERVKRYLRKLLAQGLITPVTENEVLKHKGTKMDHIDVHRHEETNND